MSTLPTVSIVIVNWNAREFLADCLDSLTGKVYSGAMQTIVVDNASSDGSAEMVQQRFPHVTLIRNPDNFGFARANNIGMRRCSGRYIALVNSDVQVLNNCIGQLVDYCESHPDVGMVGPRIIGRDGRQQDSCRGFPQLWNTLCRALALDSLFPAARTFGGYLLRHVEHDSCAAVDILSGCFWLVRSEALTDVGLLDEAFFIYGEDMDWCRRFWQSGWRVIHVPTASSIHYGGASSAHAPVRFSVEMQRADFQYWSKHHGATGAMAYLVISVLHHLLRSIGHRLAAWLPGRDATTHHNTARCSDACLRWLIFGRKSFASSALRLGPTEGAR